MIILIVLNYNDYIMVEKYLVNISKYDVIDKIIIVDNCSTDKSWEILKKYKNDRIDVVKTESNRGYAAGNNFGIKYAEKKYKNIKYLIISNPDITVSQEEILQMINIMVVDNCDMSTGIIHNYNQQTKQKQIASNFGWRVPSYADMLGNCLLGIYKIRRSVLHNSCYLNWDELKNEEIIKTDAVPGCFFIISYKAMNKIGYFDENTFLFGEENILAWKLKEQGFRSCIINNTEVLHENSVSINKSIKSGWKKAVIRENSDLWYIKHYLKKGRLHQLLYRILFRLGFIERAIYSKLGNRA